MEVDKTKRKPNLIKKETKPVSWSYYALGDEKIAIYWRNLKQKRKVLR